jgi:hypothetical protein
MIDIPQPFLVGMIHLPALPGTANHRHPMRVIIERALTDAQALAAAGFDAMMIENFGDVPFSAERIEPSSVAAIALVAAEIRREVDKPFGINALRNDAASALGIAAVSGASFIRVNIHVGVAATDQGVIEGRAVETLRYRQRLGGEIAILADVHVKHAQPISQPDIGMAAEETAFRGLADALIVTGPTTGRSADLFDVRRVKDAAPNVPVLIGSGANAETVRGYLDVADGVIVGSSIKPDGRIDQPIDADLARAFVMAARG